MKNRYIGKDNDIHRDYMMNRIRDDCWIESVRIRDRFVAHNKPIKYGGSYSSICYQAHILLVCYDPQIDPLSSPTQSSNRRVCDSSYNPDECRCPCQYIDFSCRQYHQILQCKNIGQRSR
jgi:hypothetical protein